MFLRVPFAVMFASLSGCIIIPIPVGGGGPDVTARRPVELRSECATTVSLFVGDHPGPDAPRTPLAPKSTTSIARRGDGSATVWVFDASGAIVASATFAPETRKAVLDATCTSIAAR
jgi:hypothetical protein